MIIKFELKIFCEKKICNFNDLKIYLNLHKMFSGCRNFYVHQFYWSIVSLVLLNLNRALVPFLILVQFWFSSFLSRLVDNYELFLLISYKHYTKLSLLPNQILYAYSAILCLFADAIKTKFSTLKILYLFLYFVVVDTHVLWISKGRQKCVGFLCWKSASQFSLVTCYVPVAKNCWLMQFFFFLFTLCLNSVSDTVITAFFRFIYCLEFCKPYGTAIACLFPDLF